MNFNYLYLYFQTDRLSRQHNGGNIRCSVRTSKISLYNCRVTLSF